MTNKGEISHFKAQKENKPSIEAIVEQTMDGKFKMSFFDFLGFLKQEKIRLQWGSTNSYNANYKGKRVARIAIAGGGGFIQNRVSIIIHTAERDKFDSYLEGQTDEIINMFMDSINNKCTYCRGCAPGKTFSILEKQYENVCFGGLGSHGFRFINPDIVQIENVKKLIITRKEYIAKMLTMGINPGTAY